MTGPALAQHGGVIEFGTFVAIEQLSTCLRDNATILRQRVIQRMPTFNLSRVSDSAFEHPATHMWASGLLADHPLEQLLCAWLAGCHPERLERSAICFDSTGHAYLPQIGVVSPLGSAVDPRQELGSGWVTLHNLDIGHGLQVHQRRTLFSDALLGDNVDVLAPRDFETILKRSIELFDRSAQGLFWRLQRVTHEIVFFRASGRTSFVHEQAPGAVFICVREVPTVGFFIEELAHQCGHLLLLAVTEDPAHYFRGGWDTPLENSPPEDRRSRYVVLHGLFTLAMIGSSLDLVLRSGELDRRESLEAVGRITFAARRFEQGALRILDADVLSPLGLRLVASAASAIRSSASEHKDAASGLILSGHAYDFSTEVFYSLNNSVT